MKVDGSLWTVACCAYVGLCIAQVALSIIFVFIFSSDLLSNLWGDPYSTLLMKQQVGEMRPLGSQFNRVVKSQYLSQVSGSDSGSATYCALGKLLFISVPWFLYL